MEGQGIRIYLYFLWGGYYPRGRALKLTDLLTNHLLTYLLDTNHDTRNFFIVGSHSLGGQVVLNFRGQCKETPNKDVWIISMEEMVVFQYLWTSENVAR